MTIDKDSRDRDKSKRFVPSLIIVFVFFNVYIIIHLIDVSSRHYAVAFDIPTHNIGIYLDKLTSFRVVLMLIGSLLEYLIYLASGSSRKVRKIFSLISLCLITFTRMGYVTVLYRCTRKSLRVYQVLNLEGLFHGLFQMAFFSLVPQYSSSTNLSVFISGLFVFSSQKIVDMYLFDRPLLNLKILSILTSVATTMGLFFWYHYLFAYEETNTEESDKKLESNQTQPQNQQSNATLEAAPTQHKGVSSTGFWNHFHNALSPFMMFPLASVFKYFLCPGILPYALLERDKAHLINLVIPVFFLLGSLSIFIPCEYNDTFRTIWYPAKDSFWLLMIPQVAIFVLTMMSIHTKNAFARRFINSKKSVLIITVTLIYCYTVMDTISFVGVAHYVYKSADESSLGVITLHNIVAIICIFIFTKLSVGYNNTRIRLGYHLPKFRPNHRMSKHNLAWYIIRKTFRRAGIDAISDLRMDIEKYL